MTCDDVPEDITITAVPNSFVSIPGASAVSFSAGIVFTEKRFPSDTTAAASVTRSAYSSVSSSSRRFSSSGLKPARNIAQNTSIQS